MLETPLGKTNWSSASKGSLRLVGRWDVPASSIRLLRRNRDKIRETKVTLGSSIRAAINDLLPNRKWTRRERGSLVFTDIFVRTLSERHTNLWLLPHDQSPRSSSVMHDRWMGVPRSYLFYFFFISYDRLVYLCAWEGLIIANK